MLLSTLALAALLVPRATEDETPALSAANLAGLELRGIGPALMSGRIADVAIHPERRSTWYVAVGSGGVWKTTNAGTTWQPIFDDQPSYSIGCITLDPNAPDTVWVGSGENVGGRHVGYGDGVYKSLDGGESFENVGLGASEHISRILVDPRDSNTVYVAAQGPLWSSGGDRGLFKSTDGGTTWNAVLAAGPYTGVTDVLMDPRDPDVLYAATHQRLRNVAALVNGGPETGIHKSTDGGATWTELTRGLPEEDMGKIGLALSPQNPDVVYAAIELGNRTGGFFRSANGGASWTKKSDYVAGGTGPHYYQEIWASPHAFDRVYHADVWLHVTDDGGETFRMVGAENKHSDNHAMAFDPDDPDYLWVGCDGGVYESFDLGTTWRYHANLPVTQFYKVAVDYDEPFYNVYGGTQDNSTQGGPSRTDNAQGIRNSDWFITLFADGHQPAVDPTNPDIVYSEWQEGNLVRYDRRTGEIVYIQPQPRTGEEWDRFNWDSPILISPHDPSRIYHASQRVWRSDSRGDSWEPISPDLTRGLDRLTLPMMGRVWSYDAPWDLYAMSRYGTITSLAESPVVAGLLYAGTDDGRIQVSEDAGASWRLIESLPGVADEFFVNDIKADLFDGDTAYVAVDQHKNGDFAPYLYVTRDRGRTWTSLRGDLPDRHLVWRLVQDHVRPGLLFLGTEFGIFVSVDGGERWVKLEGGAPNISFRDLAIQRRENDLVGATFGRGIYILDDYSALREISEEALAGDALFPVRDAWWYIERRTLGGGGKAYQGGAFFTAPNPPFGAVFTYYLADDLKTQREVRRSNEEELAEAGGDTPYPGWEALRAEELEEAPQIVLTVRDANGNVVRKLQGETSAGIHRIAWDLRLPGDAAWSEGDDEGGSGFLAAPGTYSVALEKRVGGVLQSIGSPQTFAVKPLHDPATRTMGPVDYSEVAAFQARLGATRRALDAATATVDESLERASAMRRALADSRARDEDVEQAVRQLEARLHDARLELHGEDRRESAGDPGPVSIARRLSVVETGNRFSTAGPTPMHLASFEEARARLAELNDDLRTIVTSELPKLGARLDALGVGWTPGRAVAPLGD